MKYTVRRRFRFSAAHRLPEDDGPCSRLHGHNFVLWVECVGAVGEHGMTVHTDLIKEAVDPVIELCDHHALNEIPGLHNPTMENIAAWLLSEVREAGLLAAVKVELWETENNVVTVEV